MTLNQIYEKICKSTIEVQRFKDVMFNIPDEVYNRIHQAPVDDFALNDSVDPIYIGSVSSYPGLKKSPVGIGSKSYSFSTSTLFSNRSASG